MNAQTIRKTYDEPNGLSKSHADIRLSSLVKLVLTRSSDLLNKLALPAEKLDNADGRQHLIEGIHASILGVHNVLEELHDG